MLQCADNAGVKLLTSACDSDATRRSKTTLEMKQRKPDVDLY